MIRSVLSLAILATFMAVVTSANAQKWQFPDSPTGRTLTAFLEMIDSGAESDVRSFVSSHMDDAFQNDGDQLVAMFTGMHADLVPFDAEAVRKIGPQSVEFVIVGLESGDRLRVRFDLEEGPPHRINDLSIKPDAGEGVEFSTIDEMDAVLSKRSSEGSFSGVVLIGRSGRTEFEKAYGLASKRFNVPNRTDTRFNIGSLNKMFTGVAILKLAEQGALNLDAPIATYLEGFPDKIGNSVTVRHLLQHRSGWSAYWDNEYYLRHWSDLRTVSDYLDFIRDIPLEFEPGTNVRYSNTGYEVLGGIIEAVSGMDYYEYVERNVFEPAGMSGSGSWPSDMIVPNLATGYMRFEGSDSFDRENTFHHSVRGTPAGGGYSTAGDLFAFLNALVDNRLLTSQSTASFFRRFEDVGDVPGTLDGQIGYAGGGPGINAVMEVDLESGLIVIVLSNLDGPSAEELGPPIMRMASAS